MATIERLPNELKYAILSFCDVDTIRSCSIVSSFCMFAQAMMRADPLRFTKDPYSYIDLIQCDVSMAGQLRKYKFEAKTKPKLQPRGQTVHPWSRWVRLVSGTGPDEWTISSTKGSSGKSAVPMGQVMHLLKSCSGLNSLIISGKVQEDYEVNPATIQGSKKLSKTARQLVDHSVYVSDMNRQSWAATDVTKVEASKFVEACLNLANLTTLVVHRAKWLSKEQGMALLLHRIQYRGNKPHWTDRRRKWVLFELLNCAGRHANDTFSISCKSVGKRSKSWHVVQIDGRSEVVKVY